MQVSGFLGEKMLQIEKLNVKAVILDMDGVLWKMTTPLIDMEALFRNFALHDIKVMFATNNATSTPDQYVQKLGNYGVKTNRSQIVTCAMATGYLMKKSFPDGGPIYISGEQALVDTLNEYDFYHSEDKAMAVAAGLSRTFNYDTVKDTSLMIQKGLPFYFTNPDVTYPTPDGLFPGAGTLLAALEAASGVKAKLAGKPLPFLFELCMQRLGTSAQETLVVGDRLNTDILGGQNSGCKTAMVLTGVNTRTDAEAWTPKPDLILENVSGLFDNV